MGLTMAEIMLLLLFCLLLASAGIINEREKSLQEVTAALDTAQRVVGGQVNVVDVAAMERQLTELQSESKRLRELVSAKDKAQPSPIPEEAWRELELSAQAGQQIIDAGISVSEVIKAVQEIRTRPTDIQSTGPGVHDWPPIITLGNDEFRFPINSAELDPAFKTRLSFQVADQVRDILSNYDVDVIEVVGHTDESPISTTQVSTMDQDAIGALAGDLPISDLVPADNVGLGLARAIAVANSLKLALADLDVKIIPLSAAQLVMPGDEISTGANPGNDADRRRIEIRVRKSNEGPTP